jgi:hypothetical protein
MWGLLLDYGLWGRPIPMTWREDIERALVAAEEGTRSLALFILITFTLSFVI